MGVMEDWCHGDRPLPKQMGDTGWRWGVESLSQGITQEAGSANKHMSLWSPAGEFAYMSKERPLIMFLPLCFLFICSRGRCSTYGQK